jgi:hypothetical protein
MTATETTFAQPLDVPVEPLNPAPSAWLPLTAGDAGDAGDAGFGKEVSVLEHGRPGDWFIFLSQLTAIGMGVGAVGAMIGFVIALLGGETEYLGVLALAMVGLSIGYEVQSTLAQHVKHFSRWGWWGAMAELVVVTLSKVVALAADPGSFMGPAIGLAIDAVWLRYFWERRQDFDIDLDF